MEFRILGPLEVASGDGPVDLPGAKARALLGLLLLHANEVVSSVRLIDELWQQRPPETAANAVQVYVSQLRKTLGAEVVRRHGSGYVIDVPRERLDLTRFEDLVAEARTLPPASAAERLRAAEGLWRGPLLDGVDVDVVQEAHRLDGMRLAAVEDRIEAELELGRQDALIPELEALVASEPLRERLRRQLMLALYRSGRQADALEVYRQTRRTLVEELGIEPSPALQQLERAILAQDPALAAAPAERLAVLPTPPTPLLGREQERKDLLELLTREDVRLLTLTGAGGIGKTRLALELARELPGARFVSLAPIADPALVLPTIAQALGVQVADLDRHVAGGEALLILDNFEHVVEAAPVLVGLLAAAPQLRIIVTSRAVLRVRGEHEFAVPPLTEDAAVELFVQRARAADRDFALDDERESAVTEICRRLDGLPLAIELAAARTKLLDPLSMLGRLGRRLDLLRGGTRDAPERQQTLRGTIDWSFALLDAEEQHVLAQLAVFVGGWTLESAEAVCSSDDLLEAISSLVDKSLVQRTRQGGEPRLRMLDTVREYALERLETSGAAPALHRRHADHFAELAARAEPELTRADQRGWHDRLELEHDNVRGALAWAVADGDAELALRITSTLVRFWQVRGHIDEGLRWLREALALPGDAPPALRARALGGCAALMLRQGDHSGARPLADESLALAREARDPVATARALTYLSNIVASEGDYEASHRFELEHVELARSLGDERGVAVGTANLGFLALVRGNLDEAEALCTEGVELTRKLGDRSQLAITLCSLGLTLRERKQYDAALSAFQEALGHAHDLDFTEEIIYALTGIAAVLAQTGADDARATRMLGAAERLCEQLRFSLDFYERDLHAATVETLRTRLDSAFEPRWEEGRQLTLDAAVAEALAVKNKHSLLRA